MILTQTTQQPFWLQETLAPWASHRPTLSNTFPNTRNNHSNHPRSPPPNKNARKSSAGRFWDGFGWVLKGLFGRSVGGGDPVGVLTWAQGQVLDLSFSVTSNRFPGLIVVDLCSVFKAWARGHVLEVGGFAVERFDFAVRPGRVRGHIFLLTFFRYLAAPLAAGGWRRRHTREERTIN